MGIHTTRLPRPEKSLTLPKANLLHTLPTGPGQRERIRVANGHWPRPLDAFPGARERENTYESKSGPPAFRFSSLVVPGTQKSLTSDRVSENRVSKQVREKAFSRGCLSLGRVSSTRTRAISRQRSARDTSDLQLVAFRRPPPVSHETRAARVDRVPSPALSPSPLDTRSRKTGTCPTEGRVKSD